MSDAFGKIFAVFVCVYLMFIAPITYMQKESQRLEETYVLTETSIFIENVKNTGIISKEEYDKYISKIAAMKNIYNIEIVHCKNLYNYETGSIVFAAENYYKVDIEDKLIKDGMYYLDEMDYIKITIYNNGNPIVFVGGGIKNEAY